MYRAPPPAHHTSSITECAPCRSAVRERQAPHACRWPDATASAPTARRMWERGCVHVGCAAGPPWWRPGGRSRAVGRGAVTFDERVVGVVAALAAGVMFPGRRGSGEAGRPCACPCCDEMRHTPELQVGRHIAFLSLLCFRFRVKGDIAIRVYQTSVNRT